MSDLKELLSKGAIQPSADIVVPIVFVNEEVDKHGMRLDIPPVPANFFLSPEDELKCILVLRIPTTGAFTDLDVSGATGAFFYMRKQEAKQISTASGAFGDALVSIGIRGDYVGMVEVLYGFPDVAGRRLVYSQPIQVMVHLPADDSTGG